MPISISCPKCRRRSKVNNGLAGQVTPCPACREPISVPALGNRGSQTSELLIQLGNWTLALASISSFITVIYALNHESGFMAVVLPVTFSLIGGLAVFGLFRAAGFGLRLLSAIESNTRSK